MKLHIMPPSPNSMSCIAVVKRLKLEDKISIVNAYGKTRTPEFLAINPCHCTPTLELDGTDGSIWESNAVLRYICLNFDGGDALYPNDPVTRGKIDMLMDWRQTTFYPCLPDIAYVIFGMPNDSDAAKKSFSKLMGEPFKTLTDVFLSNTPFCYSDKPTIADLAIAPTLSFLQARPKFWEKVPDKIKEYRARVLEAFPEIKESVEMLDGMCVNYSGEGVDTEP